MTPDCRPDVHPCSLGRVILLEASCLDKGLASTARVSGVARNAALVCVTKDMLHVCPRVCACTMQKLLMTMQDQL